MRRLIARVTYWMANVNRLTGWRMSRFNRFVYAKSGGRVGGRVAGAQVVLLTTTGRVTGRPFTVPVASSEDGDDLLVGAFAGGLPTDPQWIRNLRAHPRAVVQLKGETFDVVAHELDADERDSVVRALSAEVPIVAIYERESTRRIPMMRLIRLRG